MASSLASEADGTITFNWNQTDNSIPFFPRLELYIAACSNKPALETEESGFKPWQLQLLHCLKRLN